MAEIVTDNGSPFVKALDILAKRYRIHHIRISTYNSQAAGVIERRHFNVREALIKSADGDVSKWSSVAHSVFWAERVTVLRSVGASPYFLAHGFHPILPIDFIEATYLLPPPDSTLTTTDLMARRSKELQKRVEDLEVMRLRVYGKRLEWARKLEEEHAASIKVYDFVPGSLVLARNTQVEKTGSKKNHMRYMGPLMVIRRNRGGAYIVCELDGTVWRRPVGAFRLIPYFSRLSLPLPDLTEFLDVSTEVLEKMEQSYEEDPELEAPA